MADNALRLFRLDPSVFDFDPYGLSAIKAHRINAYGLSRKEPADRQRFECSLSEPLLLAVNGQAIMGGKIVKRRERHDRVGFRIEPARKA